MRKVNHLLLLLLLIVPFIGRSQEGALNGYFSVNPNQQVRFSKGNLQYKASANTWQFAANQYDMIGDDNQNVSSTYDGWIDLFGWGTSGWNCNNVYYRPYDIDNENGALYGPGGTYDLTENYINSDWGYYNPISNGGNQSHLWRTLSAYEWNYLCNVRDGAADLIALGTIGDVNGLILLPDHWNMPDGGKFIPRSKGKDGNNYTIEEWAVMEQAGAVFLPSAGRRLNVAVENPNEFGYYHSSSYYSGNGDHSGSDSEFLLSFSDGNEGGDINAAYVDYRYYGSAVRLVRNEITFSIQANPNPESSGYVTGTGLYTYNSTANLVAHANTGYKFNNWSENGTVVCTTEEYSFTVYDNRTLDVNFDVLMHVVTRSYPENAGVITGEGYYEYGDTVTLFQEPNYGYVFDGWYEEGQFVSTENPYSFVVTGDRTVIANYNLQSFTVSTDVMPAGSGSVIGAGSYEYLSTATVVAQPTSSGYYFTNWTEDGMIVSTDENYTFTVTRDINLTANFSEMFTVTAEVVPYNVGIVSGMGEYEDGETVTMMTAPIENTEFLYWLEDGQLVSTEPTFSFEIHSNRNFTAMYRLSEHQLTLNPMPAIGGQTFGDGIYNYGSSVTINAVPSEGYHFVNWVEDGVVLSTSEEMVIVIIGDRNITANFAVDEYIINAYGNPENCGTVTGSGVYQYGQDVVLNAVVTNELYTFVNWTENGHIVSIEPTYTFAADSNRVLTCNFGLLGNVFVSTESDPLNSGIISGAGSYSIGATVTLEATPVVGYNFLNWSINGTTVCTDDTYTFTASEDVNVVAHFEIKTVNIAATPTPAEGGIVTGAGTYQFGDLVTLSASCNYGYTFANWTENGVVVSTQPEYTFLANRNRNINAKFNLGNYYINAMAEPINGANVYGGGTYSYGDTATMVALPNEGYDFVSWTENGDVISTYAEFSFLVRGNRSLVANMNVKSFMVSLNSQPTAGGVLEGAGRYTYGSYVRVVAHANDGYNFLGWKYNGQLVSTEEVYIFEIREDILLTAMFETASYEVKAYPNPTNAGILTGAGTYSYGATATLTATPDSEHMYIFHSWTENGEEVSVDSTYSFVVTKNTVLSANFVKQYDCLVSLTSVPWEGGVTDGAGTYATGTNVTVHATPNYGYYFVAWFDGNDTISTDSEYSFVVDNNVHLFAIFEKVSYYIGVTAYPAGSGFVSGEGMYQQGDEATLVATPQSGQTFCHWIENDEIVCTTSTYTFTVDGNRNLIAHFDKGDYYVNAFASPDYAGTVTGQGTYTNGQLVTMVATPVDGHTFISWEEDGVVVSTNAEYTFLINSSRTLYANFTKFSYNIETRVSPENSGTTTGGGYFNYGDLATVTATPLANNTFINWTDMHGVVVSTEEQYTFAVTEDDVLTANFTPRKYVVDAFANPEESGYVEGQGIYEEGTVAMMKAVSKSLDYEFVNWTENGEVVSTASEYTFEVLSNRSLVANFKSAGQKFVGLVCYPQNAGVLHGAGFYDPGAMVTISAEPNEGNNFECWRDDNDMIVSYDNVYTFVITDDVRFTAVFGDREYIVTASSNNINAGTVSGGGVYQYNDVAVVTAENNEGYVFANWTEDGVIVSTSKVYSFTVKSDRNLIANFAEGDFYINTLSYPENAALLTGSGAYNEGDLVTVTATEYSGFTFISWTESGMVVSTEREYSFYADRDRTLTAVFKLGRFYIEAIVEGDFGSTTGTGYYEYGVDVVVTATPNSGFTFVNWTDNGFVVSTSLAYKFVVTNDRKVVANFVSNEGNHGIEEIDGNNENNSLSIYPNPVNCNQKIQIEENVKTVEVFNVNGLKINELHNTNTIDGIVNTGMYIVRITTADGAVIFKKLTVK